MKKLVCKKCNGNHLTFKCSKRKNNSVKVSISYLPRYTSNRDLNNYIIKWAKIGSINIKKNKNYAKAYIEFYDKKEAEYFIKAHDKTPVNKILISVCFD